MQIIADGPDNPMDNQCYLHCGFLFHPCGVWHDWLANLFFAFPVCLRNAGQNEERNTTRKRGSA